MSITFVKYIDGRVISTIHDSMKFEIVNILSGRI